MTPQIKVYRYRLTYNGNPPISDYVHRFIYTGLHMENLPLSDYYLIDYDD